jgi:hypothetical protein
MTNTLFKTLEQGGKIEFITKKVSEEIMIKSFLVGKAATQIET